MHFLAHLHRRGEGTLGSRGLGRRRSSARTDSHLSTSAGSGSQPEDGIGPAHHAPSRDDSAYPLHSSIPVFQTRIRLHYNLASPPLDGSPLDSCQQPPGALCSPHPSPLPPLMRAPLRGQRSPRPRKAGQRWIAREDISGDGADRRHIDRRRVRPLGTTQRQPFLEGERASSRVGCASARWRSPGGERNTFSRCGMLRRPWIGHAPSQGREVPKLTLSMHGRSNVGR
jgi:hypothetical protein